MVDDAGQQMMAFHRRRGKISVINYRRQVVLYMMISFLTRMLTVFHIFKQTPPPLLAHLYNRFSIFGHAADLFLGKKIGVKKVMLGKYEKIG